MKHFQTKAEKQAIEDQMLQGVGILENLEELILEWAERVERSEKESEALLASDKYAEELESFAPEFRIAIVELIHAKERKRWERELVRMCAARERHVYPGGKKLPYRDQQWQRAFRYATEEADIVAVIERFSEIKNPRRLIQCPLPSHEDRSPSFKIYEKDNRFHCFGCAKGGSPIDFVMQMRNCDFKEAVELLNAI